MVKVERRQSRRRRAKNITKSVSDRSSRRRWWTVNWMFDRMANRLGNRNQIDLELPVANWLIAEWLDIEVEGKLEIDKSMWRKCILYHLCFIGSSSSSISDCLDFIYQSFPIDLSYPIFRSQMKWPIMEITLDVIQIWDFNVSKEIDQIFRWLEIFNKNLLIFKSRPELKSFLVPHLLHSSNSNTLKQLQTSLLHFMFVIQPV